MLLKNFIVFYDCLRKPVTSSKRKKGVYPYYGAQGVVDYVDNYIFDGKYVLLAEDGNNLNSNIDDIARIANGKFWVNNHAHVLQTNDKMILEYLNYFLNTIDISPYITGSAQPKLNKDNVSSIKIDPHSLIEQQHIVDTIGTIDNLIENIEEKTQQIKEYGNKLFSKISLENLESLIAKVSFSKGKEIGSLNYLDKQINNSVPYIRVGDLLGGSYDTFTTIKDIPLCNEEDILITFDGAPGRNNYGLKGAISSGVQKVVCKPEIKGFIYFYLNSDLCQNTIQTNTQGTTILHASKAIKELKMPIIEDNNTYQKFNDLFNYLIVLSKEKTVLQKQKQLLLYKYFG